MVWFLGTGGATGWPYTSPTSTAWGSSSPTTTTATSPTTVTSIVYVTMSQTASTTMGLYGTPTWTDQWTTPPAWSLTQDRRWLAEQQQTAAERAAAVQQVAAAQRAQLQNTLRRTDMLAMASPAIVRTRGIDAAARRARELLLSYLSDDQRRTFEEHGWFIVLGGRSGRRYRINGRSYAGNVALLHHDNDNVEASFCGHCDPSIPLGDQLLAQKVMLEVDEPAYIALANRRAA